jgi:hypothetical protein
LCLITFVKQVAIVCIMSVILLHYFPSL